MIELPNMITYRATVINHLKVLSFQVIGTCLMVATVAYFDFDPTFVKVFAVFWIIYTAPAIYLHIAYFFEDKLKNFLIQGEYLIISKNNKILTETSFSEIISITISCSKNMKGFGIQQLPCESYYYLTFHLQDGSSIFCTCLIFASIKNIRKIFRRIPIMFEYALFNELKNNRPIQQSAVVK